MQLESYNREVKGEILATKQTAGTSNEKVVQLEKEKKKQDYLIDSMNEEIKRQTEQKLIIVAQYLSQVQETTQAKSLLREAYAEMTKIEESKKNLLDRWQKSVVTMQRMDAALIAIREALRY